MEHATARCSTRSSQHTDSRQGESSFVRTDWGSSLSYPTSATSFSISATRHDTKNPSGAEDVETLRIVEGLETDISGGDYESFLKELDSRNTGGVSTSWEMEEKIAIEGFRLLRYHVLKSQISKPNLVVLTGEGWTKTIRSKFTAFEKSRRIVANGLLTFLALSSLPGNYKNLILKRGGVEFAMETLDDFRNDIEVSSLACALLLSLSLNEKEGLNASHKDIENLARQLVSLVARGGHGSSFALRVLFQFTRQKKKLQQTAKSLSYLLKNIFRENENNTFALLNVLKDKNVREPTMEAAISLIWRLSVPKDEFDDDDLCLTSDNAIDTIIAAMNMFESNVIREAGCGILANISIRRDLSVELAQRSFSSMLRFLLEKDTVDEGLAICALHAICNMLENPEIRTNTLLDQKIMETIIFLMERFPKSEELIEFACLSIGRAARHAQAIKESFVSLGAFDLVMKAFQEFVTTRGDGQSLDVKDASLCAFATLTGCRSGAQAAMNTGLIDIFMTLLAVETDRDFAAILDVIIANTRNCSVSESITMSPEDTLQLEPQLFSKLIKDAVNEVDICSLIQVMLNIHQTSLRIAFCSSGGFSVFLSVISQWPNSTKVQESGCLLLSKIYFYLSYPFDAMDTVQGPWALQNQREALDVLHRAMDTNLDEMGIQLNGCSAILNLLHPISETSIESLNRQAISPVVELSFKAVLGCLRAYKSDSNIQRMGISALNVSICVTQREDFEPWAYCIIQQLFCTLLQFTGDIPIQVLALDTLITIETRHASITNDYSSSELNLLLMLVGCDNNEISGRSSTILSTVLQRNPESRDRMMECHDCIERIIKSVESKRENLQIQLKIFAILHNLLAVRSDRTAMIAATLCQHNGIHILCMGITSYLENEKITMKLCEILSSIIPCLNPNEIVSSRDAIKFSLIESLENHVENPEVETSIFNLFCTCCGHDDHFKDFLLEEARARMIINTMQFSLGSDSLQSSGCKLLSILSSLDPGKERIGNYGGISAIVNAMLAHNSCTQIQKYGLIALKNVATVSTNKPLIAESGAESTVVYALWIHYNNAEVVGIGLSALNNIAVDSVTRSVAKMNEQVLTIVISAMKIFSMNELVQKNACFYLKTCCYLPENVQLMCKHSDNLIPQLLQASDKFPEACRDRSAAVMARMTGKK